MRFGSGSGSDINWHFELRWRSRVRPKGKLWNYRKGDSRRAEKSRKALMRTKAAKLGWARLGARPEQKHGRSRAGAGTDQEQNRSRVDAGALEQE